MTNIETIIDSIAIQTNRQYEEDYRRVLAELIRVVGLKILKQRIDEKGYDKFAQYMQSFDIPLIKDDTILNCDIKGCVVAKSESKIPISIRNNSPAPFYHIGTIDGLQSFAYVEREKFIYLIAQPYASLNKYYTLINNYLFILNNSLIKHVNIRSIFENPIDVTKFANCYNCPIDLKTENFLFPDDLIPTIILTTIDTLNREQPDAVLQENEELKTRTIL